MYKFLVCRPEPQVDSNDWCFSFSGKMYPEFDASVKEAILLGYYSSNQKKWIISGTAIHLRENYQNVKKAMPDSELALIMLGIGNIANMPAKDRLYKRIDYIVTWDMAKS